MHIRHEAIPLMEERELVNPTPTLANFISPS
ncbi:hypothetical protein BH09VER1_BH09VER1_32740 [soil metagenome]